MEVPGLRVCLVMGDVPETVEQVRSGDVLSGRAVLNRARVVRAQVHTHSCVIF